MPILPDYHDFTLSDLLPGEKILFEDRKTHEVGSLTTGSTLLLTDSRLVVLAQGRGARTLVWPGKGGLVSVPLRQISRVWSTDEGASRKERFVLLVPGSWRSLCIQAGATTLRFLVRDPEAWVTRIQNALPTQESKEDSGP
jgi:hypothetical protein